MLQRTHHVASGFTLIQLLIVILIAAAVVGGGFFLLNAEQAKTRDAKRLADMARVQSVFELLYAQRASYAPAAENGCDEIGDPVSSCALADILPTIADFQDPGNSAYLMSYVPDDEKYEVTFELERSYQDISSGLHTVSPEGIK